MERSARGADECIAFISHHFFSALGRPLVMPAGRKIISYPVSEAPLSLLIVIQKSYNEVMIDEVRFRWLSPVLSHFQWWYPFRYHPPLELWCQERLLRRLRYLRRIITRQECIMLVFPRLNRRRPCERTGKVWRTWNGCFRFRWKRGEA